MDAPGADRAAALNRAAMLAVPPPTTLAWLLTRLDAAELVTVDVMRGGSTARCIASRFVAPTGPA